MSHQQHPVFKSNLENNLPVALLCFALLCGGIIKNVSTRETIIRMNQDKKLEDIIVELYSVGPIRIFGKGLVEIFFD